MLGCFVVACHPTRPSPPTPTSRKAKNHGTTQRGPSGRGGGPALIHGNLSLSLSVCLACFLSVNSLAGVLELLDYPVEAVLHPVGQSKVLGPHLVVRHRQHRADVLQCEPVPAPCSIFKGRVGREWKEKGWLGFPPRATTSFNQSAKGCPSADQQGYVYTTAKKKPLLKHYHNITNRLLLLTTVAGIFAVAFGTSHPLSPPSLHVLFSNVWSTSTTPDYFGVRAVCMCPAWLDRDVQAFSAPNNTAGRIHVMKGAFARLWMYKLCTSTNHQSRITAAGPLSHLSIASKACALLTSAFTLLGSTSSTEVVSSTVASKLDSCLKQAERLLKHLMASSLFLSGRLSRHSLYFAIASCD